MARSKSPEGHHQPSPRPPLAGASLPTPVFQPTGKGRSGLGLEAQEAGIRSLPAFYEGAARPAARAASWALRRDGARAISTRPQWRTRW